jgi:hypothetical protein
MAADLLILQSRGVQTAFCPCGVRSPGKCLVSTVALVDHVPARPAASRRVPFSAAAAPRGASRPGQERRRLMAVLPAQDRRRRLSYLRKSGFGGHFHVHATDPGNAPRPTLLAGSQLSSCPAEEAGPSWPGKRLALPCVRRLQPDARIRVRLTGPGDGHRLLPSRCDQPGRIQPDTVKIIP